MVVITPILLKLTDTAIGSLFLFCWKKVIGDADYRNLRLDVLEPLAKELPRILNVQDSGVAAQIRIQFTPKQRDLPRCWGAVIREARVSRGLTPLDQTFNLGWNIAEAEETYDQLALSKIGELASRHQSPLKNLYDLVNQ